MEATPNSTIDSVLNVYPLLEWPLPVQITFGTIAGVVVLVTILGNFSVVYAFTRTRRLRTFANFYVVSLATTDLFRGLAVTPFHGTYWALGYWPFGEPLCFAIHRMISGTAFHITYLLSLVIAIDRYISVAYPIKHLKYRNKSVVMSVIALTYIVPVIAWGWFFCYWKFFYDGPFFVQPGECYPLYVSSIYATVAVICILNWIPIALMVIMYVKVYRVVRVLAARSNRRSDVDLRIKTITSIALDVTSDVIRPGQSTSGINPVFELEDEEHCTNGPSRQHPSASQTSTAETGAKSDKRTSKADIASSIEQVSSRNKTKGNKALRTLTPIFISMMLSGLPWAIIAIVYVICPTCLPRLVNETAGFFTGFYGAMNPFCYAISNPLYQQAFLKLVCSRLANLQGRQ